MKKYLVTLTVDEREQLTSLIASGKGAAKKLAHARILLKADSADGGPAWTDERIAEAVEVSVTDRRTARDFAEVLRWLAEDVYPEAEKIVLVMDNLNTHKLASLYEAFEPEQARRIAERFEIHHTPKHGSWLNVAEIELSVLVRQCLDRRIESRDELLKELEPWEVERNDREVGVKWRFTTADARIKLRRLYHASE